ncbi:DUF1761 family protein [Bacillus mangrovi]|uniref:DUF1761 family protein n=1 Tax=Metabacillus mangrovi TaxID=1491830 RepID=A0A7X2S6W0_9BACI|nr:DUF1761 domain-containing protein [Metabacillus mangrovi]MTH54737.1 DUF1761 family protein [Metabacillus mangrovi]
MLPSLPAILTGAVLYILYGTIYYSILLKNKENKPVHYVLSIVIAFISSFLVGVIIQTANVQEIGQGAWIGLLIGVIISAVYLKNSVFGLISKKSLKIAIGDHLVIFTVLGAVHGFFG